ncbi:GNAT family N-acetyltransferase [Mangrovimonas xylaniphaga]|uniref:GNAT family N-acetyltransferase n=1 Tax=Mangrovimonas xylaniphaga TaxID=1645915 RepID=UPI0006B536E6|nr:GNAT family N-acetyltransferase [Mangrovimonas xylaniphaga]
MLSITIKYFSELTVPELYDLLRLRSEVFVVEQDCVYQDVDNKDQKALHVLGYEGDTLVAYTRLFKPGDYFEQASIGRVVVVANRRKHKYGYQIMENSFEAISEYFNEKTIKISAQCYLQQFYNNLGFKEIGESYLEDGIPHIAMLRN